MDYTKAINLLESFKVKDLVRVVSDGHAADMYISRTARRSDGKFGSPQSTRVTVTYGPGRYAREVTADQLVHGLATIEARNEEKGGNDVLGMTDTYPVGSPTEEDKKKETTPPPPPPPPAS